MDTPDTTAAETAEEPEVVETTTDESTDKPPWGADFDAERAWKTIQTQRAEAKELKSQAQRARELEAELEDEEKLLARLQQRGYEIADDEQDTDLYEDEEQQDPEIEGIKSELAELKQERADRLYQADLAEILPEGVKHADLSEPDRLFIRQKCAEGGDDKAALKKAVEAWEKLDRERQEAYGERYRKSKKTSHVSKVGTEATDNSDRLDIDDDAERHRRMAERLRMAQRPS